MWCDVILHSRAAANVLAEGNPSGGLEELNTLLLSAEPEPSEQRGAGVGLSKSKLQESLSNKPSSHNASAL